MPRPTGLAIPDFSFQVDERMLGTGYFATVALWDSLIAPALLDRPEALAQAKSELLKK